MSQNGDKPDKLARVVSLISLVISFGALLINYSGYRFRVQEAIMSRTPVFRLQLASDEQEDRWFIIIDNVSDNLAQNVTIFLYPTDNRLSPIISPTFNLPPSVMSRDERAAWEITNYRHLIGLTQNNLSRGSVSSLNVDITFYPNGGERDSYTHVQQRIDAAFIIVDPEQLLIVNDSISFHRYGTKEYKIISLEPYERYRIEPLLMESSPTNY